MRLGSSCTRSDEGSCILVAAALLVRDLDGDLDGDLAGDLAGVDGAGESVLAVARRDLVVLRGVLAGESDAIDSAAGD